jgi:putative DNA primase/helicase
MRFGLIAAAGELATMFEVVPWIDGEATRAAENCFLAWLNQRGSTNAGEDDQAIEQVRAFIEAHGVSRSQPIIEVISEKCDADDKILDKTNNRAGFRENDGDQWNYLVLPEMFKNEVCKGLDHRRVAKVLHDRGYLKKNQTDKWTVKQTIPDHGRPSVYFIRGRILA